MMMMAVGPGCGPPPAVGTVIGTVPLWLSLVAAMSAVPGATPVTRPLLLTVATAGLLLDQVMTRPVSRLPSESVGVAVNCNVAPMSRLAIAGVTVTVATGAFVTVMAAVPLWLSLVAVIVPDPAATPVTRPLAETVATALLLVVQLTVRPVSRFPTESLVTPARCILAPASRLSDAGLTVTDATGTGSTGAAALA